MYVYGLALGVLNLVGLGLALGQNGHVSDEGPEALIERWSEERLGRFLALRGKRDGLDGLTRSELVSHVRSALHTPIVPSLSSPLGRCTDLTVDQLVHWAAHHSGKRVNSHGANVFDAPPTKVRSRAKREAAVELCERTYRERVLGVVLEPERDASEGVSEPVEERLDEDQQRLFALQIAQAEAAPHVFEPDINPALDRAAKHSIYDLRDLLDVFGVQWTEEDSHAHLTELAKAHTALWIGQGNI